MSRILTLVLLLAVWLTPSAFAQSEASQTASEVVAEATGQKEAPPPEKSETPFEEPEKKSGSFDIISSDNADRIGEALDGAGGKLADKLENEWGVTRSVSKRIGEIIDFRVLGISLAQIATALVILIITLIFRGIVTGVIFRHLHRLAGKTKTQHDEMFLQALEKPVSVLLLVIGFFLALVVLPMSEMMDTFIRNLFRGGSMFIVVWAIIRIIDVASTILEDITRERDTALLGFLPVLRKSVKVFVGIVGVLMIIDNLGYNVSGVLATLGIGGAALAFASKDTIANGFGTLMIILDRPFKVGDWIMVGDKVDGDVEAIGLRSTKVRTWPKTVLSIPNGVLANEYINNWSRMPKRRVKQYVGVTYESTAEDMEGIVEDIKQLLKEDDGVQQDFILVSFTDFGDSSLNILVYYFTKTIAWIPHMEIRQRINCKIMRAIKARGLSIAFPTRSLYLDGPVASKIAGMDYQSRWDVQSGPGSSEGRLPGDFGPDAPR